MKLINYSIYDTASGLYSRPIFCQSDGEAKRLFVDLVSDADHAVGKHPEDYSLFRTGRFDDNNGKFDNEANECLLTGLEAVASIRKINPKQMDMLSKIKTDGEGKLDLSELSDKEKAGLAIS